MPDQMYSVQVGNHNETIMGIDILAILEAAFDESLSEESNEDDLDFEDAD